MSETRSRRDFLTGVLACGTLSAGATYLLGGKSPPRVDINLVSGSDDTGGRQLLIDMWNRANPDTQVHVTDAGTNSADQKRRMIAEAGNRTADIFNLDSIDIPAFSRDGLITPIELTDSDLFVDNVLAAGHRTGDANRFWAAPFNADVGVLFERVRSDAEPGVSDLATALAALPRDSHGLITQLGPESSAEGEAFVVNALEHALAVDVDILSASGNLYKIDSWRRALDPLHTAILANRITLASGEAKSIETFTANRDRRWMRNWPVAYRKLQNTDADAKAGRIKVHSLPLGILGGQSLAVVRSSRNRERAGGVIRFLTGEQAQTVLAAHGLAPTRRDIYGNGDLNAFIPHLSALRGAVENARPRPVHANYGAFAAAVLKHMQPFLQRQTVKELPAAFIDDIREAMA